MVLALKTNGRGYRQGVPDGWFISDGEACHDCVETDPVPG